MQPSRYEFVIKAKSITAFTELEREEKKQQIKLMKHKSGKSTIVRKEVAQTLEQLRGR